MLDGMENSDEHDEGDFICLAGENSDFANSEHKHKHKHKRKSLFKIRAA